MRIPLRRVPLRWIRVLRIPFRRRITLRRRDSNRMLLLVVITHACVGVILGKIRTRYVEEEDGGVGD